MGTQLGNQCCDYEITIFHFYNFGLVMTRSNTFPRDEIFFISLIPEGTVNQKPSCV